MLVRTTITRRSLLAGLGVGAALFWPRGVYAERARRDRAHDRRPVLSGPLPLDTDNDLLAAQRRADAVDRSHHLFLGPRARPDRRAGAQRRRRNLAVRRQGVVPALQGRVAERDPNFQGYGRFLTGVDRRVRLPHHPSGLVFAVRHHPRAAHPPRHQPQRAARADHAGACRRRPAQRRRHRAARGSTRPHARPDRPTSGPFRAVRSARWPRAGTSCSGRPPSKATMAPCAAPSASPRARRRSGTTSRKWEAKQKKP